MDAFERSTSLISDERSKNWMFMSSPLPLFLVIGFYLYFIYVIGPRLMKDTIPFKLTRTLVFYNAFQVATCCYIVINIPILQPEVIKFWLYQGVDYSNTYEASKILKITYLAFWLKLVELLDTVFFVLRKKNNQVSKLHVIHHSLTPCLAWLMVKYVGGGSAMFPLFLNSIVHIVMYSYYLVAAIASPNLLEKILPLKKIITIIQMIQLGLILLQTIILYTFSGVQLPGFIVVSHLSVVTSFLYLFYDFYKNAYKKRKIKD